jgi:hypothetical protein
MTSIDSTAAYNAELVALVEHIDRAIAAASNARRTLKAASTATSAWEDAMELAGIREHALTAVHMLHAARDAARAALEERGS